MSMLFLEFRKNIQKWKNGGQLNFNIVRAERRDLTGEYLVRIFNGK